MMPDILHWTACLQGLVRTGVLCSARLMMVMACIAPVASSRAMPGLARAPPPGDASACWRSTAAASLKQEESARLVVSRTSCAVIAPDARRCSGEEGGLSGWRQQGKHHAQMVDIPCSPSGWHMLTHAGATTQLKCHRSSCTRAANHHARFTVLQSSGGHATESAPQQHSQPHLACPYILPSWDTICTARPMILDGSSQH